VKDSRQIRATRGYIARLLTKQERKQAKILMRDTHKMVGLPYQKGETYVTR